MALPHRDSPRIAPVDDPGMATLELFSRARVGPDGTPLAIFRTMAHHPELLARWNAIAAFFRGDGALPARAREVVVLRTAWRIECGYEWGQHVLLARDAGLTESEIARLARPEPFGANAHVDGMDHDRKGDGGDQGDALLVRFVDELIEFTDVTDDIWDAVSTRYSVEQTFELVMLVGLYRMAGGFLNVIGVQPEPYLPTWPRGAPPSPERTPVTAATGLA